MASVTLARTWIQSAGDPTDAIQVDRTAGQIPFAIPGQTRAYAGGRVRSIRLAGDRRSYRIGFALDDLADAAWLEDHAGEIVLVRDVRGRRVFGVYYAVTPSDREAGLTDVEIVLESVTYDESV